MSRNPLLAVILAALSAAASAAPPAPNLTTEDITAFLDGLVPLELQREDIAGAVVLVVQDGKVVFQKGYGFSDSKKRTPVSPETTLFRPGSISKLFTWTAVMRMVEQGKLDLDRDVNQYLDFSIPATYPKPITLRHLMTHTPGFEETAKDLFAKDANGMMPLRTYLVTHMPQRIYPPGEVPAYSNYGTALAGYIVERVSGRPFSQYVREEIFVPLGMESSTFEQPLPDSLKPRMSLGYQKESGDAKPFEFVVGYPAGGLTTTAVDLSKFMLAHLQDGQLGDVHILRPETARAMHTRQFGLHPAMPGMALGFYEESRNGHRIIGHGGDTSLFHSDLHLVPDSGLGFFVSYNSGGKGEISPRGALWEKFTERYLPYTPSPAQVIPISKQTAAEISGSYLPSRRAETTLASAVFLLDQRKVAVGDDGLLTTGAHKLNGEPKRFEQIEPLLFREVNGQDLVAFRRDAQGQMQMIGAFPANVFQKVHWWSNSTLNTALLAATSGVMLLTFALWPVGALIRRHYGEQLNLTPWEAWLRTATRLVCAVDLCFLAGWLLLLSSTDEPGNLSSRMDAWIVAVMALGGIGVGGTAIAVYNALLAWFDSDRWFWAKLCDALLAVSCIVFAVLVFRLRLITFGLNY